MKKSIYCYETKEKFTSGYAAGKSVNVRSQEILKVLNCIDKVCKGYHWCDEDNLELFNNSKLTQYHNKTIYCYETKEKFESIKEAAEYYNVGANAISEVLDKSDRTSCGYHFCTDFKNIIIEQKIVKPIKPIKIIKNKIYCYEENKEFDSIKSAASYYNVDKTQIFKALNKLDKSVKYLHFCDDENLQLFENSTLINRNVVLYCYETKEKFESIAAASNKFKVHRTSIQHILNQHDRTSCGYHFCTELSIFDNVELIYPDSGISGLEKEVVDHIKSIYNKEIIENSKSIIAPYELDIFIPELNLAFEFNGDYWHSEQQGKDRNYHITKTNLCKAKGIQLIHIYEYQWRNNKEVWLSFIANKLKRNTNKIYARKCEVRLVESNITKEFCDKNHLQKSANSNINLGLYYNDELISLMTFGKSRFNKEYEYELVRFCNKSFTNVIGGASKLLKYFEINFKPKSLVSYADIDYSDGNLYHNLSFTLVKQNPPNYIWLKRGFVLQRYQTMKHKLEKLLDKFDSNLTESENMNNNGYDKIWKCGTYTFIKNYV